MKARDLFWAIIVLIIVWQAAAVLLGQPILPSPLDVGAALWGSGPPVGTTMPASQHGQCISCPSLPSATVILSSQCSQ